ncbi:hypothetical protein KSP39_PZI001551 [Platanthera zijinensis]|uniref:TTF-type domain-containing protein n=1 Tax=Platanthera zijinensis TaxID=2320716 RepID=A0AAP0C235_9ASPA
MDRYFKRKVIDQSPTQNVSLQRLLNVDDLPADPGLRKNINDYDPNDREIIRRWYLQKRAFQPKDHKFPTTVVDNESRRFICSWFQEYSYWLEYNIVKDVAFCLCCYLFKPEHGDQASGDAFVSGWFRN